MSITIKPVRFTENGFMTEPFALGGESAEGLDPNVKYRSCLQNWVIDTGSEVILVDTGLPAEFPDAAPTADAAIYLGSKVKTYLEALADLGYKPEQVSKILITHKHAEHNGVAFEDLPADWRCLRCKQPKEKFNRA
ncbi:MAG: MBL fold metallo-hydrolase [Kiritimatiellae bacterium]|nr:MBL fold metallo-hydrolase [Kiritimatiellia bacterium]